MPDGPAVRSGKVFISTETAKGLALGYYQGVNDDAVAPFGIVDVAFFGDGPRYGCIGAVEITYTSRSRNREWHATIGFEESGECHLWAD